MDDQTLIRQALNGDKRSFEELVRRYRAMVNCLARRLLGNHEDAEDVTQETFLRAWNRLSYYDPLRGRFSTWLHTITVNLVRDLVQEGKRRAQYARQYREHCARARATAAQAAKPEDLLIRTITEQCLSELPWEFRLVFVLRQWYGLSYKEIAEVIGKPINTIATRLHRSRLRFAS